LGAARKRQIAFVQSLNLIAQLLGRVVLIEEHIVGGGESRFAGCLPGNNREHLFTCKTIAAYYARDLRLDAAIDDKYAIDARLPNARFNEERHDRYNIRAGRRFHLALSFGSDDRVRDGFKAGFGRIVGEDEPPHLRAVERSVGCDELRAEFVCDARHRGAVRGRDAVRNHVRIHDRYAVPYEKVSDEGLTAADPACKPHDEHGSASEQMKEQRAEKERHCAAQR
jgi:hypothetical protein